MLINNDFIIKNFIRQVKTYSVKKGHHGKSLTHTLLSYLKFSQKCGL